MSDVLEREKEDHFTIQAIDGADYDGGTLYVLYDHQGGLITSSPWPQPLEAIAQIVGFPVQRVRYAEETLDGDLLREARHTRSPA